MKQRDTVEAIVGAVTGSLRTPDILVEGRYRGTELEVVGRTVKLKGDQATAIGQLLNDDAGMLLWLAADAQAAWVHDGHLIAATTRDDDDEEGLLREPGTRGGSAAQPPSATSWLGADPEPIPAAGAPGCSAEMSTGSTSRTRRSGICGSRGTRRRASPCTSADQPRVRRPAGQGDLNRGATPRRRSIPGAASTLTDGLATSDGRG